MGAPYPLPLLSRIRGAQPGSLEVQDEGGVAKAVPDVLPETHSLGTSHQASSLRPLPCSFQSK